LVLLEDFGVPVPGEIMLIAAAVIVAVRVRRGRAVGTA
jgi:membrane protein DedA with SNARE-associated domain